MPELTGAIVLTAVLVLVVGITWWDYHRFGKPTRDAGLALVVDDVDEDINNPSVAAIESALRYTDPTEREQIDRLLDQLNRAKGRVAS